MKIPFLDLSKQTNQIQEEALNSIKEIMAKNAYSSGYAVEKFESEFASYIGVNSCIAVNSGTSALHLALLALNIGNGDEVITVSHTFVSTVWAISYVGAKPVFVDIEPNYYTIDTTKIEEAITPNTKAIVAVHLYGQSANLAELKVICQKHNLYLIEDAAQAQGTTFEGTKVGNFGDIACFSFYPGKNLGAMGEGGAIVTNNSDWALRMKRLRNHAQPEKYIHNEIGYNYRMDGFQGAILSIKLKYLDLWNNERIAIAESYDSALSAFSDVCTTPKVRTNSKHIYHLYELKLNSKADRQFVINYLNQENVATGLHYPIPCHLQDAYKHLNYKLGDFAITEQSADTLLSLPIYSGMSKEQVEYVIYKISQVLGLL